MGKIDQLKTQRNERTTHTLSSHVHDRPRTYNSEAGMAAKKGKAQDNTRTTTLPNITTKTNHTIAKTTNGKLSVAGHETKNRQGNKRKSHIFTLRKHSKLSINTEE